MRGLFSSAIGAALGLVVLWGAFAEEPRPKYPDVGDARRSCMSCHQTAQHPYRPKRIMPHSALVDPTPGSDEWMAWFHNLQNFYEWKHRRGRFYSPRTPAAKPPRPPAQGR